MFVHPNHNISTIPEPALSNIATQCFYIQTTTFQPFQNQHYPISQLNVCTSKPQQFNHSKTSTNQYQNPMLYIQTTKFQPFQNQHYPISQLNVCTSKPQNLNH